MIVESWLGIRNTSPVRSIPNNALSNAVDVDVDDVGIITQRNGFTFAKSFTNITSAYSTIAQRGYVVDSGILYRVWPNLEPLAIAQCAATQFDDRNEQLFTNDGLWVVDNIPTNIKIPSPDSPPKLTITSGNLPSGIYSVCYTYRSIASGIEGGTSPFTAIELTDNLSSVYITPIIPPDGYTVVYYTTDAGGSVYYNNDGSQLQQSQILANPFPDDVEFIAWYNSRLWLSKTLPTGGSMLWFSDQYLYHSYDMVANYLIVPGQILAMESTNDGLLVGTESAIYLCDINSMQKIVNYGVVPGRPFIRLPDGTVYIYTKVGLCVGMPFQNLTENKYSYPPGITCSTSFVEQNGIQKFVTLTDGSGVPYNARF